MNNEEKTRSANIAPLPNGSYAVVVRTWATNEDGETVEEPTLKRIANSYMEALDLVLTNAQENG